MDFATLRHTARTYIRPLTIVALVSCAVIGIGALIGFAGEDERSIYVFPSEVSGTNWPNKEEVLQQSLSRRAQLTDFQGAGVSKIAFRGVPSTTQQANQQRLINVDDTANRQSGTTSNDTMDESGDGVGSEAGGSGAEQADSSGDSASGDTSGSAASDTTSAGSNTGTDATSTPDTGTTTTSSPSADGTDGTTDASDSDTAAGNAGQSTTTQQTDTVTGANDQTQATSSSEQTADTADGGEGEPARATSTATATTTKQDTQQEATPDEQATSTHSDGDAASSVSTSTNSEQGTADDDKNADSNTEATSTDQHQAAGSNDGQPEQTNTGTSTSTDEQAQQDTEPTDTASPSDDGGGTSQQESTSTSTDDVGTSTSRHRTDAAITQTVHNTLTHTMERVVRFLAGAPSMLTTTVLAQSASTSVTSTPQQVSATSTGETPPAEGNTSSEADGTDVEATTTEKQPKNTQAKQTSTSSAAAQPEVGTSTATTQEKAPSTGTSTTQRTDTAPAQQQSSPTSDAVIDEVTNCSIQKKQCHTLLLSGFGLGSTPNLFPMKEVKLKVSLAAKTKERVTNSDELLVNYYHDGTWNFAGSISFDDSTANADRGDYFTFTLPEVAGWEDLSDLKVLLEYDRNAATDVDLYLDGAWLDITYGLPDDYADMANPFTDVKNVSNTLHSADSQNTQRQLTLPDGTTIDFPHTDDNSNEELIIRSDKKTYHDLSRSKVYFSVTNRSNTRDRINLQAHFPESKGKVVDMQQWMRNVPYTVTKSKRKTVGYFCESGWSEETDYAGEEVTTTYACATDSTDRHCDRLNENGTNCIVENEKIGETQEKRYRSRWMETTMEPRGLERRDDVLSRAKRLIGFDPTEKDKPVNFKAKAHTVNGHPILPGQTLYFSMTIEYPKGSFGEFFVEAIGDDTYGLLDPWWDGAWQYRQPITIDNTGNSTSYTNQQVYIEIGSSSTQFWNNVQDDGGDVRFFRPEESSQQWYDSNWQERIPITIQASEVQENVTDFPVYVDLSDLGSAFFSDVADDGADIRITSGDGTTELPREVVSIDTNNETGELYFKADSLSASSDTTFYIYYENFEAGGYSDGETFGAHNVWNSNYLGVYHFDDVPDGSSGDILDSTGNANHGTSDGGMGTSDVVDGVLGQSLDFDGTDDEIQFPQLVGGNGQMTVSYWMDIDAYNDGRGFASDPNAGESQVLVWPDNEDGPSCIVDGARAGSLIQPTGTIWHGCTYDGSTVQNYVDGAPDGSVSQSGTINTINSGDYFGSGSTYFDNIADELRVMDTAVSSGWMSTEYSNQANPGTFYATSSVEQFQPGDNTQLDFWQHYFDKSAQRAAYWVQVDQLPANASTTINIYYGNANANSASDQYAPFTYDTPQPVQRVIYDTVDTGTIEVTSLIDNNVIQLDDGATTSIDRFETVSYANGSFNAGSVLKAKGPVMGKIAGDQNHDVLTPVAFASDTFAIPSERNEEEFYGYGTYASTSVSVFDGATQVNSFSVASGTAASLTQDVTSMAILEAGSPFNVAFNNFSSSFDADGLSPYPPTTDALYGLMARENYIGVISDGTDFDIACSGGNSTSVTGQTRGTFYTNSTCTSGDQSTGDSVRIYNSTQPIGAIQQADADGGESTFFWPEKEFGAEYFLPTDTAYVAIACAPKWGEVSISIFDTNDEEVASGTCSPSGDQPGQLRLGQDNAVTYNAGYRVVSTDDPAKPFYAIYEDVEATDNPDGDENNVLGVVQSRLDTRADLTYTIGASEVSDEPRYTQADFRWYANEDAEPPTDPWPAGSEDVSENQNIEPATAVSDGERLRLRQTISVGNATATEDAQSFTLQYAEGDTCDLASLNWKAVGKAGSGAIWRGYSNSSLTDGTPVTSLTLSSADVAGTYEEENDSVSNPNDIGLGEAAEYDWVIENNGAPTNETYCFRVAKPNGNPLFDYSNYAKLNTNAAPNQPTEIAPFDNEQLGDLTPALRFNATDDAGDSLHYQVQIDTGTQFTSPVLDVNSANNPVDFTNITQPSDKAPFAAGNTVEYVVPNDLASSTTYYWRVRALDPNGSGAWGEWSEATSFTLDQTTQFSTWYQTQQEQFQTDTLSGTKATDQNDVRIGAVGEYGRVTLSGNSWQEVQTQRSYKNPIVVANPRYAPTADTQRSPRIRNKTSDSFEIKVDNYAQTLSGNTTVDYVVMEEGSWTIEDGSGGTKVVAGSREVSGVFTTGSTLTGDRTTVSFSPTFDSAPAVIHTVSSNNDASWVTSGIDDGSDTELEPTTSQMGLWLMRIYADSNHDPENVDYIAFDPAHGTNNGSEFDATTGSGVVGCCNTSGYATSFTGTFSTAPQVALIAEMGMNGADGGFAVTHTGTPISTTDHYGSIDEDGPGADRSHTEEEVGVLAFETATGTIQAADNGVIESTAIDFDDGSDNGNKWGQVSWNDDETSGSISYQVQYKNDSGEWVPIPDTEIAGNSTGIGTSPIGLEDLDTQVYNELRLRGELSRSADTPILQDWTVTWTKGVSQPALADPFSNAKVDTDTPQFTFSSTDPEGDDIEYQIQLSTSTDFTSGLDKRSGADPGFANEDDGGDSAPFTEGDTVSYTVQESESLTPGQTYWWRVRARDPGGDNVWSFWSDRRSFTVDESIIVSTWHQTSQEQFQTDTLSGLEARPDDSVGIQTDIGEYGTVDINGTSWTTVELQNTYSDLVVTGSARYEPDAQVQRSVRVRNKTQDSFEVKVDNTAATADPTGTTTVDWLAMEAGTWEIKDGGGGTKVIARTEADVSEICANNFTDTCTWRSVTFGQPFDGNPAVLATVASNNDSDWVATYVNDNSTLEGEPTASEMGVALNRSFESASHGAEDIDIIAFDQGHGRNNGKPFDAVVGSGVDCCDTTGDAVSFNTAYSSAPNTHIVQQMGENGGNGGWANTHTGTPVSNTTHYASIDEGGSGADRSHTTEEVGLISFASSTGSIQRVGGALSGTLESTAIDFDDGTGPKWGQLTWSDSEPGSSEVTYQVLYATSSGYQLVPDTKIPGNSSGTSTQPIDLSNLQFQTYNELKLRANVQCTTAECPTLNDWTVDWSEGINVSGEAHAADETTDLATGTVAFAINGTRQVGNTAQISNGSWTLTNVNAFPGDVITVFIDGASDSEEAVAVTKYDGTLDISGMELIEQRVTIGSEDNATLANSDLAQFDNGAAGDEDVFFEVDGSNDFALCAINGCGGSELYIKENNAYRPDESNAGNVAVHDIEINGSFTADANEVDVGGSWDNNHIFNAGNSQITFTQTGGVESVTASGANTEAFNDVTFGEGSGSATWLLGSGIDIDGSLTINHGTLDQNGANNIDLAGDLLIGAGGGFSKGTGTTTFNGSSQSTWTDNTAAKQNLGTVIIDGSSKIVQLGSNVAATDITIGGDDVLNANSNYDITVSGDWENNNSFSPQQGTVIFTATSTGQQIRTGASDFYNLTFNGSGGNWVFPEGSFTVQNDLAIQDGVVTLPAATTTVGGSIDVTGGSFMHNNGAVVMDANNSGNTIDPAGSSFAELAFTGSGAWSFTDNATTSDSFRIESGDVTLPAGTLAVRGAFNNAGGTFDANAGEVSLITNSIDGSYVRTGNSDFHDLRHSGAGSGGGDWYDTSWDFRIPVTVQPSEVDSALTGFPMYVDLATLGDQFFSNTSGDDIRVTAADGTSELPREVVSISTSTNTGELHFKAPYLSSTSTTKFYIYFGNSGANGYAASATYGAESVWSEYAGVWHMDDGSASSQLDSTDSDNTASPTNGNGTQVSGQVGDGINFTNSGLYSLTSAITNNGDRGFSLWYYKRGRGGGSYGSVFGSSDYADGIRHLDTSELNVRAQSGVQAETLGLATDAWHYVSFEWDGSNWSARANETAGSGSGTQWFGNNPENLVGIAGNDTRAPDGIVDEMRVGPARSAAWRDAEYSNQYTPKTFYATSSVTASASFATRTFKDASVSVIGDLSIVSGSVELPSDTLSVVGSLTNGGTFAHNMGEVRFVGSSTGNTIDPGSSSFFDLSVEGENGGWTIADSATTSNAFAITDVSALDIANGSTIEVQGAFTNTVDDASTDFANTTLHLNSGTGYTINDKQLQPETYGTLKIGPNTDVKMWDSTASSYDVDPTGSLYSQDHGAIMGELYIWGDYRRSAGTEHWSYETDFDGADLTGGSERQVDVRLADGASVTVANAGLNLTGVETASTTVNTQSTGSYNVSIASGSTTARYFRFRNAGASGLSLTGTTTVNALSDGDFELATDGGAMLTVATTTLDTTGERQFEDLRFATSSGVTSGFNVADTGGTASSSWWFRNAYGNYASEDYDDDSAGVEPGNFKWDDSGVTIDVSGTVYSDHGITQASSPLCDDSTQVVRLLVDGTDSYSTSCSSSDGSYTISGVSFQGDVVLTTYLDTGGGQRAATITRTPADDIATMDLYADTVIARHEQSDPLTIAQLAAFDGSNDADVPFTAATSGTDTLTVEEETELHVWQNKTLAPNGEVTVKHGGTGSARDGRLHVDNNATFAANGSERHTIGGTLQFDTGAVLQPANAVFELTATTTGKAITATQPLTFHELQFTGAGGGWDLNANTTVEQDVSLNAGTLSGSGDLTVANGTFTGDGALAMEGGTVTLQSSGNFAGNTNWQLYNLTVGDGTSAATTTKVGAGTITVDGVLDVANAAVLEAGDDRWQLTGGGTPLVVNGTFAPQTSTVAYTADADTSVQTIGYHDLELASAGTSSPLYTTLGGSLSANNLTIGNGTNKTRVTIDTNDPALAVAGNITIAATSSLTASDSATFTVGGSWENNGTFSGSGGTVTFTASSTGQTIAAGSSAFSNVEFNNAAGGWTITEHASTTGTLTLTDAGAFSVADGVSVAVGGTFSNGVGGAATDFSNSTLNLVGDDATLNSKTLGDTYGTLRVGSTTAIRMWNSSADTYEVGSGSLYSQDHAGVDGDLVVFGDYVRDGGADYWSYATDFDGTDLSGGSERQVSVRVAPSATTTLASGVLDVLGADGASTTIDVFGSGTYSMQVTGGTINADRYRFRNLGPDGFELRGSPTVSDLSNGDFELAVTGGTLMSVAGSVIDANQLKILENIRFATSTAAPTGTNVTSQTSSISSWRFDGAYGGLEGESYDSDVSGDPGQLVWDDSAADITISGTVYSDEGSTVSSVCDGSTQVVRLKVDGAGSYTSACDSGDGSYQIDGVVFNPGDTLTVYLDTNGGARAANVSVDPVSSINGMDLYEDRLILRHEDTDPITIEDIAAYDSSDDADAFFTAASSTNDTLTLPSDAKLIVWQGKTFAPGGDITLNSAGTGNARDGSLELQDGASFNAASAQVHEVGGNWLMASSSQYTAADSLVRFTANDTGNTITARSAFNDIEFTGSGSWSFSEPTLSVDSDLTIESGTVTLPTATTTIGGTFDNNGGAFAHNNGLLEFTSGTGETLTAGGSSFSDLLFTGSGSWSITDTSATATDVTIDSGSLTLPPGTLALNGSLDAAGGSFAANGGEVRFSSGFAGQTIALGGSTLNSVTFDGTGSWSFTDTSATVDDTISIQAGTVTLPGDVLTVGGSFRNNGTFNSATGTVLMNAADTGNTLEAGSSTFHNIEFSSASGGWTITEHATATNNVALTAASSFTLASGKTLRVEGTFTNEVGGGATSFSGSTLSLGGGASYSVNSKSVSESYGTLEVGSSTDVRLWNSDAGTISVDESGSLYSQDHAGTDGLLRIYGDYRRESGTDYWSYATDFDGANLTGGSERAVAVRIANGATSTHAGAALELLGAAGATTSIDVLGGSGSYALQTDGGQLAAEYFSVQNANADGLELTDTTVSRMDRGNLVLGVNGGSLITIDGATINKSPSLLLQGMRFARDTGITGGVNVYRTSSTTSSWNFDNHYGVLDGEDNDVDGATECGAVRWDDSSCLFVSQEDVRWRNDDGGQGVPPQNWYSTDWSKRTRIHLVNNASQTLTDQQVQLQIPYDGDMQSDFDDLRFTDEGGTTTLDYWIEDLTAGSSTTVWVEVPEIPADGAADVYMYYGNPSVADASSGSDTFAFFDGFEDQDIGEYSGDTSLFDVTTSFNWSGSYGLNAASGQEGQKTSTGIYRTGSLVTQGQTVRVQQYVDTSSSGNDDEPCVLFGVQGAGSNYGVCLDQYPDLNGNKVALVKDVTANDNSGTTLATTSATYETGWYEVIIDWKSDNTIDVTVYDESSNSVFATLSATDSTYTSGGVGFSFWAQHGGWDRYTVSNYTPAAPSAQLGIEQVNEGASWRAPEDVVMDDIDTGETARLRLSVVNTGAQINNQNFQLEYAELGTAPNCPSVDFADYQPVSTNSTCTQDVCMGTSTQFTNFASTTQLLSPPVGERFTYGQMVKAPNNATQGIDVPSGAFTELEYTVRFTQYTTDDNYCFRVSDSGSDLDNYESIARASLQQEPEVQNLTFNGGDDIALTEGTTTEITATATAQDLNGVSDLDTATSTFYRSGVGPDCSPDDNNCYKAQCSLNNCSGTTCDLSCSADIVYHADATDIGSDYEAQEWRAQVQLTDTTDATDLQTAPGVEMLTLRALSIAPDINYGTLAVGKNTGNTNASTTVENTGNSNIDVSVNGSDLTGSGSSISVSEQKFATSSFAYSSCALCQVLTATSTTVDVNLPKPNATATPITDRIYWGIEVPEGTKAVTHTGTNFFTATGD